MDAREAYADAARLCEEQASAFEWQARRAHALPSDLETAKLLRELAERIRSRGGSTSDPQGAGAGASGSASDQKTSATD